MSDITEFTKQIAELAQQYGTPAIAVAREAAHVSALSDVVTAIYTIGIGVVSSIACYHTTKKTKTLHEEDEFQSGVFVYGLIAIITLIVAALTFIIGISTIIDPWTWAALFNADLALARHVLKL